MTSDEQPGKTGGADAGGASPPVVLRKPTRARLLWIAVVVFVFTALLVETRQAKTDSSNLLLNGDAHALGAEVLIDGRSRGKMTNSPAGGPRGAVFYGRVGDGRHRIEVRKEGFKPFLKEIEMHREDYLRVELSP